MVFKYLIKIVLHILLRHLQFFLNKYPNVICKLIVFMGEMQYFHLLLFNVFIKFNGSITFIDIY